MPRRYVRLDGSTNRVQRMIDINRFNRPGSDLFIYILNTRAGAPPGRPPTLCGACVQQDAGVLVQLRGSAVGGSSATACTLLERRTVASLNELVNLLLLRRRAGRQPAVR